MASDSHKIKLVRIVIREVFKKHPGQFFLVLFFGFLAGIFGGVGVGAILPLFAILTNQVPEEANFITSAISQLFTWLHLPFTLPIIVVFIAFLFVVKSVVQFVARYIYIRTAAEYEERMRRDLLGKTLNATWSYLLECKAGFLDRVLVSDIANGASVILLAMNLVLLGTGILMYVVVAVSISVRITLLTIGFGLVLFLLFKPIFFKIRKIALEVSNTEKDIAHRISETITGAKIIKASGVEESIANESYFHFRRLKDMKIGNAVYQYSAGPAFEPIGFIFVTILFIFYYNLSGFSIVSFAATVYLVEKMFGYMQNMQGGIHEIGGLMPYLQTILQYRSIAGQSRELAEGVRPFEFTKAICFKDVGFDYDSGKKVLSDISFSINKGETVGLIGQSGAGKTTIVDLLLRLFNPTQGRILLDNSPISEINLKEWRRNIRYVPQDVFLLNDTIESNIRFYNSQLSNEDIERAAKMANIYDFITSLPQGFNSVIGERGVKISGGERQRIALARALAHTPRILVLDEATSSLDNESEIMIQKAVEDLRGKVTVLIIAHRLSTVMNSDKLIILEEGKIVEEGQPKELLKDDNSYFYRMYNAGKDN